MKVLQIILLSDGECGFKGITHKVASIFSTEDPEALESASLGYQGPESLCGGFQQQSYPHNSGTGQIFGVNCHRLLELSKSNL